MLHIYSEELEKGGTDGLRLYFTFEAVYRPAKLTVPVSTSMARNCPHSPQCKNHNRKCTTHLIAITIPQTSLNPSCHTSCPPPFHAVFPLKGIFFPLRHQTNALSFKVYFKWHLLGKFFSGSLMLFIYITFVFGWKGIRDWKTRQDISIHQLIAWFTPWLSSIGLNQRDLECIFYFLQEGISIWDDARLPRPKMEEFSHELLQPAPRWGFAECS